MKQQKMYPSYDEFVKVIDYERDQAELKNRVKNLEKSQISTDKKLDAITTTLEANNTEYIKNFHELKELILSITSKNDLNHTKLETKDNSSEKREKIHERIDCIEKKVKDRSAFYTIVASAIIVATITIVLNNFNII